MSVPEYNETRPSNPLDSLVHIASNMSRELRHIERRSDTNGFSPGNNNNNNNNNNDSNNGNNDISHTATSLAFQLPSLSHLLQIPSASATPTNNPLGNSPQPDHDSLAKQGKIKRMACVECRQQKSRCDAHEKYPNPCTRCLKKGLQCDLKSDYKRTYKRARIAQIEREFHELKKTLTATQAAELTSKFPSLVGTVSRSGSEDFASPTPAAAATATATNATTPRPFIHISNSHANTDELRSPRGNEFLNTGYGTGTNVGPSAIPHQKHSIPSKAFYQVAVPTPYPHDPTLPISEEILVCEEKLFESITLSSQTIKMLYIEYVTRYHPIFPVVDIEKGPERIYRLCPALFWVMMFVSLRRIEDDYSKSLLIQMSPVVKSILAEIMISPITRYNPSEEEEPIYNVSSVYSVQAFLLYSFWPPITSSLSADSSYNTVNTGFFQAIRISLHAPSSFVENLNGENGNKNGQGLTTQQTAMIQEQVKTWILSNVASQYIATSFGFPACVQFDSSIWFYSKPGSRINIPQDINVMLEIAQFQDQMAKSLNSNPNDSCGLAEAKERVTILKLLEKRLNEIETKVRSDVSKYSANFRIFEILAVKVHLFSYFFMDSYKIPDFELKKGLIKLYNSAVALIEYTKTCQGTDRKYVKYLPGVYLLNLWQAACITGKLVHSELKEYIDVAIGRRCFEAVVSLTMKASILKHDMAFRSSGITKSMWPLFKNLNDEKKNLLRITVRNRMSASVFFDCLNLVREQVGLTKMNAKADELKGADPADDGYHESNDHSQSEVDDANEEPNAASKKDPHQNSTSQNFKEKNLITKNRASAELRAREIIRTKPLDPEPISIDSKRSSIFKIVNSSSDTSPLARSDTSVVENGLLQKQSPYSAQMSPRGLEQQRDPNASPQSLPPHTGLNAHSRPQFQPQSQPQPQSQSQPQSQPQLQPQLQSQYHGHPQYQTQYQTQYQAQGQGQAQAQAQAYAHTHAHSSHAVANHKPLDLYTVSNTSYYESPAQLAQLGYESLDLDGFDTDLLWKDVDSVMNDFGFHLD
ncbi:conserved hypothetical protein [Lodderomyces elongisporus NRRL YB-4239]|uniref:Zn(2)-C6 fungal-type domain-containing protein n=1 Tax=Lodderomyces elongisporus (strain ATCC 11503 / CBS 2605 / JCM 1781 / NBRC 1676 / NRRL YB-4239) TaxID=379508 RepID=A5E2U7_LODEL|nr:conserved hypothetical protein [Lodderomyces elongisporus NRRL YB-4239]